MPSTVVLGTGIIGLSTAYYLSRLSTEDDDTTPTPSSAATTTGTSTGKWVPRWKRDPNAVPSVRLYSEVEIKKVIPGEHHSHTFTRGVLPAAPQTAGEPKS